MSAVGAWRSLEAHLNGVQGVGGSNPLAPTRKIIVKKQVGRIGPPAFLFFYPSSLSAAKPFKISQYSGVFIARPGIERNKFVR